MSLKTARLCSEPMKLYLWIKIESLQSVDRVGKFRYIVIHNVTQSILKCSGINDCLEVGIIETLV